MNKLKLLVIGHGRHGKDTVCEMLRDEYNYNFISSSQFCADHFIYNELKDKHGYNTAEECYADRHNHRKLWYDMISDYNLEDPGLLGSEIFKEYDIYCGLRNIREWRKMKQDGTYDVCIWVDRSKHLPPEDESSMSLTKECADVVLDNNGSLDDLRSKLKELIDTIKPS